MWWWVLWIVIGVSGLLTLCGLTSTSASTKGVCAVLGIGLLALSGWGIYSRVKPISVNLEYVDTLGTMEQFVSVVPGKYTFEVVPHEDRPDDLLIAVTLELKETWTDTGTADAYSFVPLSKTGIILENEQFLVSDAQRFGDFLARSPGSRMAITFRRDTAGKGDAEFKAKNFARSIYGFEARDSRSQTLVVAVSAFRMEEGLEAKAGVVRAGVVSGLQANSAASRFTFVDTSFIDTIMEQHEFEMSDWSSGQKVAEIGKALNANIIVTGEVASGAGESLGSAIKDFLLSERDKVRYSITLLDINTMEILGTAAGIAANIEAVKDVAAKMSIRLPVRR